MITRANGSVETSNIGLQRSLTSDNIGGHLRVVFNCPRQSFLFNPADKGRLPEIKEQIIDMALNGHGICNTAP